MCAPHCWLGHISQLIHAQEYSELLFEAMLVPISPCDSLEGQRRPHQGLLMKFTYSRGCFPSEETCSSIRTRGQLHVRKFKWVERTPGLRYVTWFTRDMPASLEMVCVVATGGINRLRNQRLCSGKWVGDGSASLPWRCGKSSL